MYKVFEKSKGDYTIRIYKKESEFQVKVYKAPVFNKTEASYFTDDRQDAFSTAEMMLKDIPIEEKKVITITTDQAWVIRKLLKNVANNMGVHCNKTFCTHFESEVIDCHNWLEHEMIKQLKKGD